MGSAAGPERVRRQSAEKTGAVIAGAVQGLPELDAVLGLEVAARQIVRAGERNEGGLALLVERADGVAHRRRERPVGVSASAPLVEAASGRAIAIVGRDS